MTHIPVGGHPVSPIFQFAFNDYPKHLFRMPSIDEKLTVYDLIDGTKVTVCHFFVLYIYLGRMMLGVNSIVPNINTERVKGIL